MTIKSIYRNSAQTLCILFLVASGTMSAQTTPAATPIPAVKGALAVGATNWTGNKKSIVLGWSFSTGDAPMTVTSLGYADDGAVGTAASHTVGIYDSKTQELLAPGVVVTTTGQKSADGKNLTFTYVKLAKPLKLAAGTAYTIAATTVGTGWYEHLKDVSMQYGIALQSVHCAFLFDADSLAFPSSTYAQNDPALLGPNFLAQ